MNVFNHAPEKIFGIVLAITAKAGREQVKQGAEALAARAKDVFADLLKS